MLLLAAISSAIALIHTPRIPSAALPGLHAASGPEAASTATARPATATPPPITATPHGSIASQPTSTAAANIPAGDPPAPSPTPAQGYIVRLHPDSGLYVGDQVSFEVVAPPDLPPSEQSVQVELPNLSGERRRQANFGPRGIGARLQADLQWVWDTSSLLPGTYNVRFTIVPDGPAWTETVTLAAADQRPANETGASWEQVASQCCKIDYISGTAAARDIEEMKARIDHEAQDAAERLGITSEEPIEITLLPRVLGHGGFAGREISVSYLDRDYMGGEDARIIHHEIVHILDGRLGGELRPAALVEGLAVYLSGGHFKAENLLPRAAALLPPEAGCQLWSEAAPEEDTGCGLDLFIPLERLIDNFYYEQHEAGYLESGALIAYMVERWGWPAFSDFYRDIHPVKEPAAEGMPPGQHSYAVNAALKEHFGVELAALEQDFRLALENQHVSAREAEDLRLTLLHFDTARRYQELLDPSAHFLTAWLLDTREMQKRQITADYLRRPSRPENLALETMLVASGQGLISGDYSTTRDLLTAANRALDAYPQAGLRAFSADPLAADYLALTQWAVAQGYEPQQITLTNGTARMAVSTFGPELMQFTLVRQADEWMLLSSGSALENGWFYGVQLHKIPLSESNGGWQYRFR